MQMVAGPGARSRSTNGWAIQSNPLRGAQAPGAEGTLISLKGDSDSSRKEAGSPHHGVRAALPRLRSPSKGALVSRLPRLANTVAGITPEDSVPPSPRVTGRRPPCAAKELKAIEQGF